MKNLEANSLEEAIVMIKDQIDSTEPNQKGIREVCVTFKVWGVKIEVCF